MIVAKSVCPYGDYEYFSRSAVNDNARIAYAVLGLGKPSPFSHIHYYLHFLPRNALVPAAAHTDVYIVLKVHPGCVSHVIYRYERAVVCSDQSRYSVDKDPVVHILAHTSRRPVFSAAFIEDDCRIAVQTDSSNLESERVSHILDSSGIDAPADIEPVFPFYQFLS